MKNTRQPPAHYNPPPMFGLRRAPLSRTARAIAQLLRAAGERGIERERIAPMLYMADVIGREYLGRPITDVEWKRGDLP